MKKLKWTTISIYVDMDSGEVINKLLVTQGKYIIIKKTKSTQIHESTGNISITNECRKSRQTELEFGNSKT